MWLNLSVIASCTMEETNHASLRSYKINITIPLFLPRNVLAGTGKSGQTTISFPAVMMTLAPKTTAVLVAGVVEHRSVAFHVNIVTMGNVERNMDIVRFTPLGHGFPQKFATAMGVGAQLINARFVPNIRTTFNML